MIYFIQAGSAGPIKIGLAADVFLRMADLQVANHETLYLLGVIDGDADTESSLHCQFAALSIRGEWFVPAGSLVDFIAANTRQLVRPKRPSKPGFQEIIDLFPDRAALAEKWIAHGRPITRAQINMWHHRNSVPSWAWGGLVTAARELGRPDVTYERIAEAVHLAWQPAAEVEAA